MVSKNHGHLVKGLLLYVFREHQNPLPQESTSYFSRASSEKVLHQAYHLGQDTAKEQLFGSM